MKLALHLEGRSILGSEQQALLIAAGFIRRGHEVVASCRAGGPVRAALKAAGVRTTSIRPRGDVDVVSALRFAGWLRRERPDALLLTSWKRVPVAGWAASVARVPVVAMRRGGLHRIGGGLRDRIRRHAFTRWYDLIIVNCGMVRRHTLEELPELPESRVPVILSGIEPEVAPPADIARELRIPASARIVVAIGGVAHRKGMDLLAEAVAELDPDVHVLVAGGGSEEDEALVRSAVERSGVSGRFHLLGYRSDVGGLLAAADAFAQPSRLDSLPNAMLEAMAAEVPVVATSIGGVEEALSPRSGRGPAGWVVPREDVRALAGALREVLEPGARDRVVDERTREARWRVENWFGVERMVDEYVAALMPPAGHARGEPLPDR